MILILALIAFFSAGLLPRDAEAQFVTPWGTVPVDAEGTMTGVSKFIHSPSGQTIFAVDVSGTVDFPALSGISGVLIGSSPTFMVITASEILAGSSTYGVHGNMSLSEEHLGGRVGEIIALSSPIINLGNVSSAVTGIAIFTDLTTAGNDSGATFFCPSSDILEGVGSNYTSGNTVFVITGNTGFTVTFKETSKGWKLWGTDADDVKRP